LYKRRLRIFAFRIVTKRVIVVIIIINSGNNKSGDRNKSSNGKLKYCQPFLASHVSPPPFTPVWRKSMFRKFLPPFTKNTTNRAETQKMHENAPSHTTTRAVVACSWHLVLLLLSPVSCGQGSRLGRYFATREVIKVPPLHQLRSLDDDGHFQLGFQAERQ
jgi:hypothetical protein